MDYITYYTTHEGGQWLPWPGTINTMPDDIQLEQRHTHNVLMPYEKYIPGSYKTQLDFVSLHSFRTHEGREWDCINGWRVKAQA